MMIFFIHFPKMVEQIAELINNHYSIMLNQTPPYKYQFDIGPPLPLSQSFEDLVVSVEVENAMILNPMASTDNWQTSYDMTDTPTLSIYSHEEDTKSGAINGIRITVDLGRYIDFLHDDIP